MRKDDLAKMIEHSLLKPDTMPAEVGKHCLEAAEHGFAGVCVNGVHVPQAARMLTETGVKVCTGIGFPLGASLTSAKVFEATAAVAAGAGEVDMVIAIGHMKSGDSDYVLSDIKAVVDAVKGGAIVKVILETCLLTDSEKRLACRLARDAGAAFVKTSTGFQAGGATEADVRLMREEVGSDMGVKAAGGIRTRHDALRLIAAGADRLGTSHSIAIVNG